MIRATASRWLSICWTFTVVQTEIPARSNSSISWYRFACRLPGADGVRELIHESHVRATGDHSIDVHLPEPEGLVLDRRGRNRLQPGCERVRSGRPWDSR